MELSINMADKAEVNAAIALLQLAAGHSVSLGVVHAPAQPVVSPLPTITEVPATGPVLNPAEAFAPQMNPAAAFGDPGNAQPTLDPAQAFAPAATGPAASTASTATLHTGTASQPQATAPVAASTLELDKDGIPWDERIHQATKGKTVKDLWKVKKGADKDMVASVIAELKARVAGQAPAAAATVATPAAQPGFVPPVAFSQPAQPAVPSASATPQADPTSWAEFMPRISGGIISGVLTTEAVNTICQQYQLPSVVALQQHQGHIPFIWSALKTAYPALQ